MKKRALIVDDEPDLRQLLSITLNRMGLECFEAADLRNARRLLNEQTFDLCLTDMMLPDGNGIELVHEIQSDYSDLPVAVVTAYGNVETAVDSLKAGAFDFIAKPVNINQLRDIITAAIRPPAVDSDEPDNQSTSHLLGDSKCMQQLRETIRKVALNQTPVHIHGATGTGKELVAKLIHEQSGRHAGPWVPINCGAIPSELLESEFFGHVKGSFTGAYTNKSGLFEAASGGTLFLDEVAELSVSMQVKLLRAIQERKIKRVGGVDEIPVDVRILSATHQNLAEMTQAGSFRKDLFYRINVINIEVPPLSERSKDIATLSHFILDDIHRKNGDKLYTIEQDAINLLENYQFPGNVRELENILERACALTDSGVISADDIQLPDFHSASTEAGFEPGVIPLEEHLAEIEKQALIDAMEQSSGNKTRAADLLGMSFRAFRYKAKKYKL